MAERRKVRGGTGGGRTSTRSRESAREDEQDRAEAEPEAFEEEEPLDAGEPDEADERDEADEPDPDEPADEPDAAGKRPAMTAGQAAKAALSQIAALTAKQPEGVTVVERSEDGWTVGIELVEDQRIPSSSDILATYETTIDADGELLSYRRVRRYARGRGDTEEP